MDISGLIEKFSRWASFTAVICLALCIPSIAFAEGLSGYAEYNYSLLNSNMSDATGKTMTKSSSINQRYSLTLDKNIFPTLRFSAMGIFENNSSDNDINGLTSSGSSTRISPNADLSYSNGVFNGGAGLNLRQGTSIFNGVTSPTLHFDSYNARFGWRPENFPTLDILYSTFNNYDESRAVQDTTTSATTISSRYKPLETVDINYTGNFSTLNSKLSGFETESFNQSLRMTYNDTYFMDRVAISSSYNIATQDTKSQNNGNRANATFLPLSLKTVDQLYFATTALTDDAATTPSLGGPSNLKAVPTVSGTVITSTALTAIRNNVGIQSNFSPINIIRIPVAIALITGRTVSTQDYTDITNAFGLSNATTSKVKVYKSPSTDGTSWKLLPSVSIIFGPLTNPNSGALTDGFEINLGETIPASTILKVEIESVQSAVINQFIQKISLATPEVYLQDTVPLAQGQSRKTSQISGLYNLSGKARLLSLPLIYYDFGFNLDHSKSDSQAFTYRYTLVNGLSLNHRFNQVLSTSARIAREDTSDPQTGSRSSNSASISLSAQPLPTLTQSVNYGYRQETDAGVTRNTHSVNLSNSAELYQGVSLSLTAGGSMANDTTGSDQKSLSVTTGLNLLPHRTLSINLSAADSQSWSSTLDKPETSSSAQTGNLSVTFNPVPNIYLFGSFDLFAQTGRKLQTAHGFGGSWSPFRGGALLFNTSYRQTFDSAGNKENTIVESLRWNIRSGWFLDLSYLIATGTTISQTSDSQVFNTTLRMSF